MAKGKRPDPDFPLAEESAQLQTAEAAEERTLCPIRLNPTVRLYTDKECAAKGEAWAKEIAGGRHGTAAEARARIEALFYPLDAAAILAIQAVTDALNASSK
jgi:hypothetical protein